jgi:hypothetical protein
MSNIAKLPSLLGRAPAMAAEIVEEEFRTTAGAIIDRLRKEISNWGTTQVSRSARQTPVLAYNCCPRGLLMARSGSSAQSGRPNDSLGVEKREVPAATFGARARKIVARRPLERRDRTTLSVPAPTIILLTPRFTSRTGSAAS